jgi:hypothetical protein
LGTGRWIFRSALEYDIERFRTTWPRSMRDSILVTHSFDDAKKNKHDSL